MKQKTNTLYRTVLSLILGLFLSVGVYAQQITVSGVVQDKAGEPIIGASVVVVGTKTAAATNVDGEFRLLAKVGDKIQVSYVGYKTVEVPVTSSKMTITIEESSEQLENLVVLGYGAASRKQDLSASVGVVSNTDELVKRPVTSTEGMLQGQLPGVTIEANGGDPTANPSIVIRGQGSQNGDNVLWVVDGVPGAPISSLNDIESIVVLKDAASAAIYGAQSGAGGVVLVTTKKAKQGITSLSYEGQFGFRKASKLITPLDAQQAYDMRQRSYTNAGFTIPNGWNAEKNPAILNNYTNWMDEIFRSGFYQRHNVAVNGGTENFASRVSLSYTNDEGILKNTYRKELGVRYNGEFKLNKWVTVREDLIWKNYESRTKGTSDGYTGPILSAIWMPSSVPVIDPFTGTWSGTILDDPEYIAEYGNFADAHGDVVNPMRILEAENLYNRTSDIWSTTSLEIGNILEGLKFTSRFTYNVASNHYKNFNPRNLSYGKPNDNNTLSTSTYRADQWIAENTLTYDNKFGKHSVSGLFSVTADHWESRGIEGSGNGLVEEFPFLQYLKYASTTQITDYLSGPDANVSLVARVGYSYDDRYFATASWRRDIAGRLVKQSNSGDFPAVTAAWKISSEDFFNNKGPVNLLKVRASWGKVGNLGSIGVGYKAGLMWSNAYNSETAWYGIMNNAGGNKYFWGNMAGMSTPVNPNLTWETSEQWDLGVDMEFFNHRLSVAADYFDKKTNNLIQTQTIDWPDYIGLGAQLVNLGEISNRGVEFAAGWNDRINKDWSYYINGNFAYLKNKVTNIGVKNEDGEPGVWTGGGSFRAILPYIYQTCQGGPLGQYYLIKTDGIFQSDAEADAYVNENGDKIQPNAQAGDLKFVDFNGDGVIDDNDRQYMGNSTPDWTYAFNLGATWKNLTVSAMFQGVAGAQAAYVGKSVILSDVEGNFNRSAEILNAWSPENRGSDIPRLSKNDPNGNFSTPSDWYLEDASYFRLKNITVNYDFSSLLHKCNYLKDRNSRLNLYFSADNVFTITKYTGMDPECGGWDALKYPVARVFTLGINLTY